MGQATNSDGSDTEEWDMLVVYNADGDFDDDNDVDQEDFGFLQACYSGSGILFQPGCGIADFNSDLDIDQEDFSEFMNCMKGPNQPSGC